MAGPLSVRAEPQRVVHQGLFLSVALMESLGIRVKVCAEPEYADVDGFVLLPGDRAVIATWVRAESIWRADCVGRSPAVRTFADVTGHVNAHSVTEAATPGYRLAALAAYLGLDWPWLRRRCADLGQHGCAGLARPRSRLLSSEAVDAACASPACWAMTPPSNEAGYADLPSGLR